MERYPGTDEALEKELALRYTLSPSYIVRHDSDFQDKYILFDIKSGDKFKLSNVTFAILKLLENNHLNFNEIITHLKNIDNSLNPLELKEVFREIINANFLIDSENSLKTPEERYYVTGFENLSVPVTSTPYEIELHPTKACNLKCKHCAYDSGTKLADELEAGDWLNLFDELERLRVLRLILSGGEPLIYPHSKELLDYLRSKKLKIDLLTNGTLLDQELANILASPHFCTTVSLDGAREQTHNQLRGSDCFNDVFSGLELLAKNRCKFGISTVVNKQNIKEMEAIVKIGIEFGARSIGFVLIDPIGRAAYATDYLLSKNDIISVSNLVKSLQDKYNEEIQVEYLDPSMPDYKDLDISNEDDIVYCTAGTTRMAIRSDGAVLPCVYAFHDNKFLMGNIAFETAQAIWGKPQWNTFRGATKLKDLHICSSCEFSKACTLKVCRLRAYYQTKDFFAPPSNCYQVNFS